MNQSELLEFIEKWVSVDPTEYKRNIKAICYLKGIKPSHIVEALNIPVNTVKSFTSLTNKSRIDFLVALRLAEYLKEDIKDFLKNSENI